MGLLWGEYHPCKVVSKNIRKHTAFVKFYNSCGLSKTKQLVSLSEIRLFQDNFDEYVIGEDEEKRDKYLAAKEDL